MGQRSDWAILVQSEFKGKARVAYACLSMSESVNYETVKEAVLKTVEMDTARLADQLAVAHKMYKEEVSHKQGGIRLNRNQNYDRKHKYKIYSNVKQSSPNYSKGGPPNQVSQTTVGNR
ncbi:hypothetical protein Hamer_G032136 [Homarus americanus]|uniref:Uncharacterized protein n=1 Tax=Homarus americanus TaxID=6706 RepID=A0A8J5JFZ6_HOMAM|nr:hypothetical protein Hamer_G032136 [Homarus americanus]